MAANGYPTPLQDLGRSLIAQVKGLTVAQLKDLLRRQGLTVSGVKSELQIRAIANIEKTQNAGDHVGLENVQRQLKGGGVSGRASYTSPYPNHTPGSSASPSYSSPVPNFAHPPHYSMGGGRGMYQQPVPQGPKFHSSPFYTIIKPLTPVIDLKIRETTRDSVRASVTLQQEVAEQLLKDSKYRVMVFCTTQSSGYSDIAFPHQVELKCNGEDVKANLRGLKNKPGSTRPADITQFIRKKQPAFRNEVELVYALTNKEKPATQKFHMVVNFVAKKPVDELVREIRHGKTFSKEAVLREMRKEAADTDIEVSSRVISLKCPIIYTRMRTPCRGTACNHNQCFDATSYLQLQEQAPTWTCPQCNKPVPWHQLVLDQYVLDILNNTSEDTEQVTIEPDGRWHIGESAQPQTISNKKRKLNATPDSDSDDLVVLDEGRPTANGSMLTQTLTPSSVRTPPVNGREDSVATSNTQRSVSKRPRQEVIDLTLSDDDDDQDARPPVKRNSTNTSNPNSTPFASSNLSMSLTAFRTRPPDQPQSSSNNRYQFNLPPINSPHSFNFNSSSFGSGSGGYGGMNGGSGGSNY